MNRAEPSLLPPDPHAQGAWPPGHRIGSFELQQVLPRTGSARIYRAWDHALSRPVAVKEFLPAELVHRDAQGRLRATGAAAAALFERGRHVFLDEARRLARCDHPALARVLQLLEADGTAYCVLPWYAGRPVMDVPLALGGPLPEAELRTWLGDLLGALEAWHHVGGFHGGVHPGKTLLLDDGHGLLLAPGAASRITATGDPRATPGAAFQPDEQLYPGDHQAPGPWTDFHALAAVARYAMTGLLPPAPGHGPAEPLAATLERLFWDQPSVRYSPELTRALDAAMSPDIARRPHSAAQFRRWLRDLHDTVLAPLSERPRPVPRSDHLADEPFDTVLTPLSERPGPPLRPDQLADAPFELPRAAATPWADTLVEAAGLLARQASPRMEPPQMPAVPSMPGWTHLPAAEPAQEREPSQVLEPSHEASYEVQHAQDGVEAAPVRTVARAPAVAVPDPVPVAAPDPGPEAQAEAFDGPHPEHAADAAPSHPPEAPAAVPPPAVASAGPAPTPAPTAAASAPTAPQAAAGAGEEEVDAATAAAIRQLIDDIPDAPPPPRRRGAPAAPAAAGGAAGPPTAGGDETAAAATAEPSVPGPLPEDAPVPAGERTGRWHLGDPRLVWAVAAILALVLAGTTAWQLRPRPGLNVSGDDLPVLARPGPVAETLPRGPAAAEPPLPAPPPPAATPGPRGGAPAAAPAPARTREGGPRQQCGSRTEFSLYRCMQQQCALARWTRHPQCESLRRTDRVE